MMTLRIVHFTCLLVMSTFTLTRTVMAGDQAAGAVKLGFRNILANPDCRSYPNYENGAPYIKDYRNLLLPDCFLINKKSGVNLTNSDISAIKISKVNVYGNINSYRVHFIFNTRSMDKMEKYTTDNKGHMIVLDIDGSILAVVTIVDTVREHMDISIGGRHLADITDELSKICDHVDIK
jgi:hypothetical protein